MIMPMIQDLIARGGPVMYVLLACSIFSIGIVLERTLFWLREIVQFPLYRLEAIVEYAQSATSELPPASSSVGIFKTLQSQADLGNLRGMSLILKRRSDHVYERGLRSLSGLDTIVSIAPLLGILGTVLGIMKSFHALDLQHMTSPGEVGHGLAEAMITTATGLIIAVPALVFYNLFSSLARRRASRIYQLAEGLLEDSYKPDTVESGEEACAR